ncbi:alpha/beta fold hydrolase [Gordonia sp. ABSL1-1]|uniref:alpha/beta hydrolase n=1 Tax=Gordonia sp. ABSL1-1 TaxID=3053923 RepID=UPI002573FBCC|nr:alpha/beta fold hydrolase [Gordonia sp. ABSL1-1]MDL9937501.1 alpha/beta fold hydrolase [Gordonia sp. ABSL1-1]
MSRTDVEFDSGDASCSAWLYLPDTPTADAAPPPILVMAHGLGAVREMRLDAFAERFVAAGYACLVFDYRGFGTSEGTPRQLLSVKRQLADWSAAIDYARSRPEVDRNRVILWGTSFSGGHVLVAGARDGRVAAVIAQCPFTDGLASLRAMEPKVAAKVTVRAIADLASVAARRAPVTVALAGEPGSTALMTAPDVVPGYLPLVPDGVPFVNAVPARVGLAIPTRFPGRSVRNLDCPTLICACDQDSVAPVGPTVKYAATNPKVRLLRYDEGHFDIYVGDAFEKVVADQLAFLGEAVPIR